MHSPTQPPADRAAAAADERPLWRQVAVPAEHGGWGLTLEPVLLGLVVAWSLAGLLLGLAAFVAFVARTPAKLVVIDRRRGRWLPRTSLALRVAIGELLVIAALAVLATARGLVVVDSGGDRRTLVGIEWWYDIRSRGRRLVPELLGAVGVAASAAAIVVAGDGSTTLAAAVWMILAARSIAAIPFVRCQIMYARRGVLSPGGSDAAQIAGVAIAVAAAVIEPSTTLGAIAVAVVAVIHRVWSRRQPPPVKVVGYRQMLLGLLVVAATATGALL